MGQFARGPAHHPEKKILEYGFPIQAEPLRLVFIRMRLESDQVRHLRKNPGGRIREWDGPKDAESRVFTERDIPCAAIALFVQRKHDSAVSRRRVEGARGMAKVMFEVQDTETCGLTK